MGLFPPKPVVVAPAVEVPQAQNVPTVDIRINPTDGSRVVTIVIPPAKEYTEEDLVRIEQEKGKRPLAICDITGDLIFNGKNINQVTSEREELNGKILSTKFLRLLLGINDVVEG